MKLMMLLPALILMAASAFAQSVTVTGTDLSPTFSPGTSTPIVSLSFSNINTTLGPARITNIQVDRTGTATIDDVEFVRLYEDADKNNVVDVGETQLDIKWFLGSPGTLTFIIPDPFYLPTTTKNLLIVYDVKAGATTSHTAGAKMLSTYISDNSGGATVIAFAGILTGNQPLPVELTSFTALVQNKTVNLEWSTATEVNNYGFEIERLAISDKLLANSQKLNANSWSKIGFVQGHGNSNSPKEYSFEDKNPQVGKLQYRLKQIDFDGTFEYSNIVEVEVESPKQFVVYQNYPNPFNPTTNISYEIPVKSNVVIKVYNVLGSEVADLLNEEKLPGKYQVEFKAPHLPSGIYFYSINAGEYKSTKKMILLK